MGGNPCRETLRGGEAKCNGGAYDGCACGPYNVADYKALDELSWKRKVGTTRYRPADNADLVGAVVMNADDDAIYLESRVSHRKFVVHIDPLVDYNHRVEEYKGCP